MKSLQPVFMVSGEPEWSTVEKAMESIYQNASPETSADFIVAITDVCIKDVNQTIRQALIEDTGK